MIDSSLFLTFVVTVTVLMLIPGPNVALIVANSMAHGVRYGLLTVAGTSAAMVLQLSITALGLTEILGRAGSGFEWLRWIGAGYLVAIGVMQWRARPIDLTRTPAERKSPRAIVARALLVSLTNPKTLLFYGAFFPQFVSPVAPSGPQVALLACTFLALAVLIDGAWALLAARTRNLLVARGRLRNRISGSLLVGAGTALALTRHS